MMLSKLEEWISCLVFVNPGTECNIIQDTLLSDIFVFLVKQRMSHALTGFNLVLYRQICIEFL